MAVLQMQRICICALKKERKQILEFLQRQGVIEISDVIPEDSIFRKTDVFAAESLFQKNIFTVKESLKILEKYAPEKKPFLGMLEARKSVSSEVYDNFYPKYEPVKRVASRIFNLEKAIAEHKAEIVKRKIQIETLVPWTNLDIPLDFKGTRLTAGFVGILPSQWELEAIYGILAEHMPVDVTIISSSKEQTCIFVLCAKEKEDKISEILRSNGFSYPSLSERRSPAEQIAYIKEHIKTAEEEIRKAEEEIRSYENSREELRFLQDYETMRSEKYEVLGNLLQSKSVFVMNGYITKAKTDELEEALNQRFHVSVEFEDPAEDEEVPVMIHNNGFSAPLEGTVEAFSLPGKGEPDPTMIMSLFYYLLFGLMLSDAAYGAIIAGACSIGLIKFKGKLEDSMKNTLKMYLFCGISTIFWGIIFGSYFGDIVDVVSETFFGNKIMIPPVWFFPVNEPMRMLVFSMALGLIHLLTGLGVKGFMCMKDKDYKAIFYDVIFWFVLIISSVVLLLSMKMFTNILGVSFIFPKTVGNVAGALAVISSVGIILTNGRESRNPFKRFLKGLYALYGITGYLSDVLSYSRLLALGLATGIICTVINKMAAMTAMGPLGIIPFVLVFILGHALNISINALGAYVHTNRLQYVEFFGKFFEGGGRKFEPFKVRTNYYNFKEKIKNE